MSKIKQEICEEAPVHLNVNERKLVTFMCTPQYLNELAVGHLFCKGLITSMDEVALLAACDDMRIINVKTKYELHEEKYSLNGLLTTGCGSEAIEPKKLGRLNKITPGLTAKVEKIRALTAEMFDLSVMHKESGGTHCACLANTDEVLVCREDVGRHNAVDKVIGRGLMMGVDFSQTMILTTGRISSDMALKAAAAGIPIAASRSIPTTLALEIAESVGVTIVGRAIKPKPIVYTHTYRVIEND